MSRTKIQGSTVRAGVLLSLLLLFSMAPRIGLAYKASFEGSLVSNNPTNPPVVVAVYFESNIAGVYGNIRLRLPGVTQKVLTGVEVQGTCDLLSDLGESRTLKMKGACSRTARIFEGTYSITSVNFKRQAGVFRLTKTNVDKNGRQSGEGDGDNYRFSGPTPAHCTSANVACLVGCPRGEYNTELLCANRCKAKMNACKAGGGAAQGSTPSDSQ